MRWGGQRWGGGVEDYGVSDSRLGSQWIGRDPDVNNSRVIDSRTSEGLIAGRPGVNS